APVAAGINSKQPVADLLVPNESWREAEPGQTIAAVAPHNGAETTDGRKYVTDAAHQIWLIDKNKKPARTLADKSLPSPAGLQLSIDQHTLFVTDPHERHFYAFQIQADGLLTNGQPYCYLHVPSNQLQSGAGDMAIDTTGRLYV